MQELPLTRSRAHAWSFHQNFLRGMSRGNVSGLVPIFSELLLLLLCGPWFCGGVDSGFTGLTRISLLSGRAFGWARRHSLRSSMLPCSVALLRGSSLRNSAGVIALAAWDSRTGKIYKRDALSAANAHGLPDAMGKLSLGRTFHNLISAFSPTFVCLKSDPTVRRRLSKASRELGKNLLFGWQDDFLKVGEAVPCNTCNMSRANASRRSHIYGS
jgi:hypothetical protein